MFRKRIRIRCSEDRSGSGIPKTDPDLVFPKTDPDLVFRRWIRIWCSEIGSGSGVPKTDPDLVFRKRIRIRCSKFEKFFFKVGIGSDQSVTLEFTRDYFVLESVFPLSYVLHGFFLTLTYRGGGHFDLRFSESSITFFKVHLYTTWKGKIAQYAPQVGISLVF